MPAELTGRRAHRGREQRPSEVARVPLSSADADDGSGARAVETHLRRGPV